MPTRNPSRIWTSGTRFGLMLLASVVPSVTAPQLVRAHPALVVAAAPPGAGAPERQVENPRGRVPHVADAYRLAPAKADALFTLLSFQDARVRASHGADWVRLRHATPEDRCAIDDFVALLTREEGGDITDADAFIAKLRQTWDATATYELAPHKADALFAVLAFNDVPVLVSRAPGRVTVESSAADQQTVARVVEIIRGKRLQRGEARRRQRFGERNEPAGARPKKRTGHQARKLQHKETHEQKKKTELPESLAHRREELERRASELQRRAHDMQEAVQRLERQMREHAALMAAEIEAAREHRAGARSEPTIKPRPKVKGPAWGGKEPGPRPKPKPQARAGRAKDNEIVTRRYDLPREHADNLYRLLAPDDIEDVSVGRDGEAISIRASVRDHRIIKRLVELLTRSRGSKPPAAQRSSKHAGES